MGPNPVPLRISGLGLRDCQILVLDRLGLGAAEVVAQGVKQIAPRGQGAEFPVRDIVEVDPWRRDVIAQIAAGFVKQGLANPNGGGRGGGPGHHLAAVVMSRSVSDDRQFEREALLDQPAEQRPFGCDAPMAFALDP